MEGALTAEWEVAGPGWLQCKCQSWVELRVGTRALRAHATLPLVAGRLCRYFPHPLAHGLILPSLCYKYTMHESENSENSDSFRTECLFSSEHEAQKQNWWVCLSLVFRKLHVKLC